MSSQDIIKAQAKEIKHLREKCRALEKSRGEIRDFIRDMLATAKK